MTLKPESPKFAAASMGCLLSEVCNKEIIQAVVLPRVSS